LSRFPEEVRVTGTGASPTFVVRAATADDAPGIAEAHVASWRTAYRGLLPTALLDGLSVERRTAGWAQSIGEGTLDIRVASSVGGTIAGFVATGDSRDVEPGESVGELYAIYLRPEFWKRGLGRALIEAGTAALEARFDEATLWVLDSNARARAFYEDHGWRPDGAVKHATIQGTEVDEVRYRCRLGSQRSEG
jgi:ribosomal protein S18 acetylase RimI-like enzyme